MKRILLLAVIAVFVMMPLASFAKTAISDSDLSLVTAQDGVVINFDNFFITSIAITEAGWGDTDGFTAGTTTYTQGWVGATITTTSGGSSGSFLALSGNLTIDVGTNGSTAVKIGLPGISVNGAMTAKVVVASTAAGLAGAAANQTLGTAFLSGITLGTSGYVVVSPH